MKRLLGAINRQALKQQHASRITVGTLVFVALNMRGYHSLCNNYELQVEDLPIPIASVTRVRGFKKAVKPVGIITPTLDHRAKFYRKIVSFLRKLKDALLLMYRSLWLATVLVPVGLTVPLALSSNSALCDWWWDYLKSSVRLCGPCLTKFSQWMATRPDIWGNEICDRMKDLQSSNSFITSRSKVVQILNQEFGNDWERSIELTKRCGKYVDDTCDELTVVGTGCIAQVVKGRLVANGESVAIKIIHPGVRESIFSDIAIMKFGASIAESIPSLRSFSIADSVEEFATFMLSQLDFKCEGNNLAAFRKNFHIENNTGNEMKINFPKPIFPFVSENVIVESYVEGVLVSSLFEEEVGFRKEIANIALHALLKMVFEDNFIHGDLHPGNIICRFVEDDTPHWLRRGATTNIQMNLIDAGLVVEMNRKDRLNFIELFSAVIKNDGERVGHLMVERSRTGVCFDKDGFAQEMKQIVASVHESGLSFRKISVSELLSRVMAACYKHQVKLESKFISCVLAMTILEGLGKRLNPDIDLFLAAGPYIAKAAAKMILLDK